MNCQKSRNQLAPQPQYYLHHSYCNTNCTLDSLLFSLQGGYIGSFFQLYSLILRLAMFLVLDVNKKLMDYNPF